MTSMTGEFDAEQVRFFMVFHGCSWFFMFFLKVVADQV